MADVYVALLVWIAIATLLSYAIERLWCDFTSRRVIWYAMAPGVVVHELSHLVACSLTGAKVRRVVLFGPSGGSVTHTKPRMPILGQPLISLAPIAGCTLALWAVWWAFSERLHLEYSTLPAVDLSASGGAVLWQTLKALLVDSCKLVYSRRFLSPCGLAFLYLVLTFSICMAPSRTDLWHALLGLTVIGAIVVIVNQAGPSGFTLGEGFSRRIMAFGWNAFTFSILLLMSALVVSVPAAVIGRLFGGAR